MFLVKFLHIKENILKKMDQISIPNHLAIIVDGNRRWARIHSLPAFMGHKHGFERLEKVIDYAAKIDIPYISLFVFSTENFKRDTKEVDYLMELFCNNFFEMAAKMKKKNIKQIRKKKGKICASWKDMM